MKRIAHNGEPPKTKEKLEIIHSDISGRVNPSINNKKIFYYFYGWIFKKSLDFHPEAPDISIIDFFIYLNNQFKELSIKKILELMGAKNIKIRKINKLCIEYGIEKTIFCTI